MRFWCFGKRSGKIQESLDRIEHIQLVMLKKETHMAGELELLQTKVDEQTVELQETHAAADLAVAKIAELRQAILDNANNPAALLAMVAKLDAGKLEADAIQAELTDAATDVVPPVE